jgi:hypothetical protein
MDATPTTGTDSNDWVAHATRRIDRLFHFIEAAVAYCAETDRILAAAPLR